MHAVKLSSTNQANKQGILMQCPVTHTLEAIGARWKPQILWELNDGDKRYGELKRKLVTITEKVLIEKLKSLEADGLIIRESLPTVPPHVTYRLTEKGKSLGPILKAMAQWGLKSIAAK